MSIDPHAAATARRMYLRGRTYREIKAATGLSPTSIQWTCRKHGIIRAPSTEVTGPADETGIGFALGPEERARLAEVRLGHVRDGLRTLAEVGE